MPPRLSWIIVGAVVAVGVFAGLDALRSSDEPPLASAERDQAVTTAPSTQPSFTLDDPEEPPSEPPVGEPVLNLQAFEGPGELAIYAEGRVIWPIKDGDPGYLQIQLTPAGAEALRSRAVSTGLFKQNQGLTLDSGHDPGSMEVRHGDRSVILVWGDRSAVRWRAKHVDLERISAASTEVENEVIELVMFFRDPTAWRLPRRMYVQPEASPFVPSRLEVGYDLGKPHVSTLPSPAREVLSANLQKLISDGCQVVSTDQAREMARALAQAGIPGGYDRQRGLFSFEGAGSFVHSFPVLPHEVACEDK
jgi:hypothetical protein